MKRKPKHIRSPRDLAVDEILFDSYQLKTRRFRWENRLETRIGVSPMRALAAGSLILLLFFLGRIIWLETVQGRELTDRARQNYIKEIWTPSPRGIIYSSDEVALAANASTFTLVIIPAEIPRDNAAEKQVLAALAAVSEKSTNEVASFVGELERFSSRPVPFMTDLTRDEIIALEEQVRGIPGLRIEENLRRRYPTGPYFSHIIGYTGLISKDEYSTRPEYLLTDIIGKSGIEQAYEDALRGIYGKTEIEITSRGSEERVAGTYPSEPGHNVRLFVNAGLQQAATDAMQTKLDELGLGRGAVVALDPRSGGILALQSFPTYDNNVFSGRLSSEDFEKIVLSEERPLFNRAIAGLYPPGSTIKPFIGTAALEENVITANTTVNVTGSITVAGQTFHDNAAHGIVDLKRALAVSSNVYFYIAGGGYGGREGLGPERIKKYLDRFGFGSILGIDISGEQKGLVPSPEWKREVRDEPWYIGDTYNISIGQGDTLVSPLQLAAATAAIANGGVLLKPRLVQSIIDPQSGEKISTTPTILRDDIASSESINLIRDGMREMVLTGVGRILGDLPVSAAGKTGTAQFGREGRTHAWFTVFAPYENPEIVLTVLVEGTLEGSLVAVPTAHEILKWYFSNADK